MSKFRGVFANLPTPFDDTGEQIDFVLLGELIDFLLVSGVQGLACLLSSGEYPYLQPGERHAIAEAVVHRAAGRVPVIVGVSAFTTSEAIGYAQHAEAIGADAAMLMPIQYWPLRSEEVVDHFRQVAAAIRVPVGVYDNPPLGGYRIQPDTYVRLVDQANVRLSKDSSGDITHVAEVVSATGGRVAVLHGNHMEMLPAYLLGAAGVCTAMASVFPEVCLRLYQHCMIERNWERARGAFLELLPLFRFFQVHSLSRCVKEASQMMGRPLGAQRRPLTGLSQDELAALRKLLASYDYV